MSLRVLITAGPTHEPIDRVRYIANRSSGAMGLALAEAARDAGGDVTLLLGPVAADPPTGIATRPYTSSKDLTAELDRCFKDCDVLIMAAAVADYRPKTYADGKLPRTAQAMTIELEPVPDLVAHCAATKRPDQRIVGFALEEPQVLQERATQKLHRKGLDAIVANPLQTMGAADIEATLILANGATLTPGPRPKAEFAKWLMDWIQQNR